MFDACAVGHITKDIVRIRNAEKEMPGGTAYYFSIALKSLGSNVSLITKAAEKDKGLMHDLIRSNIDVHYRESQQTTVFENIYPEDIDFRIQNVRCVAEPFSIEDIPDVSTRIFHVGPLTKEDVPLEVLKHLSRGTRISLDIQGFLRKIEGSEVKSVDWGEKDEGLVYVDILKTGEREARILSGEDDMRKAAARLSGYGIDEVIITLGSKGSLIYSKGNFHTIPSFPARKLVDATGCGDTYMAGYLHKRLKSSDIDESGVFAAATASLKLEKSGPFEGSEEQVQDFLRQAIEFENV